jgi:GWxTD domain-containing protein
LYYTGAAVDDSTSIREYRADLALVADSTELAAFDRAHGPERAAMLRRFWAQRDHRELRPEGERLREHYARILFARTHFYLENTRRHYWQGEPYRSGSDEFDDRAIIYIRHGRPSKRVTPFVYALTGNESWRYSRPDGDLLFHFTVREDLRDYRLASSIFDLKSTGAAPEDQLIMSRQDISPLYAKLGAWGPFGRAKLRTRERTMGEASIAEGTVTDSHVLQFDDSLGVRAQLLAVGRAGRNSLVHIAFALTGLTAPDERGAPSHTPVRVRFAAFDATERRVAGLDSNSVMVTRGHDGTRFFGRASLAVPPGKWRYRLAVESGARQGTLLPWDSVVVGQFNGTDLQVSDLVLGTSEAPLTWRPTVLDTAYSDPSGEFPRDGRVELYYEVYGLERGQPYRTILEIMREHPVLHLEFEERAQSDVSTVRRTLDLVGLEPGRYRVRLEAIDQHGRRHHASAPLRILER